VIPAKKGKLTDEMADAYIKADIQLEQCFNGLDPMKK
jgi:hypothetical protein